jgi:uncharacterized FlaG/YvyC family protein
MDITLDTLTQTMLASNVPTSTNRPILPEQRAAVDAVKSISQTGLFGYDRELTLTRDPSTRQDVVKITNKSTGETIGQLPAEIVLQIQAFLQKG